MSVHLQPQNLGVQRPTSPVRLASVATLVLATFALGCGGETGLPAYDGKGVRYPTALVAAPSGKYVYVVGANFDRTHRAGVVRVLDTVAGTWVAGTFVEVPTYASGITLQPDAAGPGSHRLFVPSRENDSISVIDVSAANGGVDLSCGTPGKNGTCADEWRIGGAEKTDLNIGQDPVAVTLEPGRSGQPLLMHVAASVGGRLSTFGLKDRDGGGVEA